MDSMNMLYTVPWGSLIVYPQSDYIYCSTLPLLQSRVILQAFHF